MSAQLVRFNGIKTESVMSSPEFVKLLNDAECSMDVRFNTDKSKIKIVRQKRDIDTNIRIDEMSWEQGTAWDWETTNPKPGISRSEIRSSFHVYSSDYAISELSSDPVISDDRHLVSKTVGVVQLPGMIDLGHAWLVDPRGEYVAHNINAKQKADCEAAYPYTGLYNDQYGREYDVCGCFITDTEGNILYYDALRCWFIVCESLDFTDIFGMCSYFFCR